MIPKEDCTDVFWSILIKKTWDLVRPRDGRPAPRGPALPRGSGQNCGAFAGQNENHTLNSINGDDDYDDDYEC